MKFVSVLLLALAASTSAAPEAYASGFGYSFDPYTSAFVPTFTEAEFDRSQYHAQDEYGQYSYGYNNADSAKSEVRHADGSVTGGYTYIDANGIQQTVRYISDALGFRTAGTNIPAADVPAPDPVAYSQASLRAIPAVIASSAATAVAAAPVAVTKPTVIAPTVAYSYLPYASAYADAYTIPKVIVETPAGPAPAPYVTQTKFHAQSEDGAYSFGFTDPNSARVEQRGPDGSVAGTYHYIDSEGRIQTTHYTADAVNGFRAASTGFPIADVYSSPTPVVDTPEVIAARLEHLRIFEEAQAKAETAAAIEAANAQLVANVPVAAPEPVEAVPVIPDAPVEPAPSLPIEPLIPELPATEVPVLEEVPAEPVPIPTVPVVPAPTVPITPALPAAPVQPAQPVIPVVQQPVVAVQQPIVSAPAVAVQQPIVTVQQPIVSAPVAVQQPVTVQQPYVAAPVQHVVQPAVAPVASVTASQYHAQDEQGQFSYGYSNPVSSKQETKTADGVVRGAYSYLDGEGKLQTVQYISDALGFRVAGTNIPVAPGSEAADLTPVVKAAPATIVRPQVSYTYLPYASAYDYILPEGVSSLLEVKSEAAPVVQQAAPVVQQAAAPIVAAAPAARTLVQQPVVAAVAPVQQVAAVSPVQQTVPVAAPVTSSQYHAQDEYGQVSYGYSNKDSAKQEVKTADGVTRGSYSYVDANGKLQTVQYISDALGFRAAGTNFPVGPAGDDAPMVEAKVPYSYLPYAPAHSYYF